MLGRRIHTASSLSWSEPRRTASRSAAISPACSVAPMDGAVKRRPWWTSQSWLWDLGCYEVSLGATIGVGTPLRRGICYRPWAGACRIRSSRENFYGHLRPGAGQSVCGDGEGARVIDSAARRSRRLPPTRRVRPANVATRTVSICWRGWELRPGSICESGGGYERGQPPDRPTAGEPASRGGDHAKKRVAK